jgi:PEGA domain
MGELKISASPDRAEVFVDDQFAGHLSEFNGLGKAMLLTPGQHRVRIALPGYLPFENVVDLQGGLICQPSIRSHLPEGYSLCGVRMANGSITWMQDRGLSRLTSG